MPTLQITLPEPLQKFVMNRIAELGFDCPDQYFEKLLEEERQRKLEDYYMEKVNEGLASGPPIRVTPGFWDNLADEIEREFRKKVTQ